MSNMKRAGLLAICLVAACGVGEDPPPGTGSGSGSDNNTLGRICTATLSVMGSFTPGAAAPTNPDGTAYEGCWPIGTWNFTAQVAMNDCDTAPTMLPSYSFQGTLTTDAATGDPLQNFKYLTDPTAHAIVHVSAAGYATCEGELGIYSPDGKQVWNLKPWLNTDHTIIGEGEYDLYGSDQWAGISN
jgi:hypothetical protein